MKALLSIAAGILLGYFLFRTSNPEIAPEPKVEVPSPPKIDTPPPKKTRSLTEILAEAKKDKVPEEKSLVPVESGGKTTIREETIGDVVFTFVAAEEELT